ncbi:TldD/PmbA family protein [Dehalococcoidia bacterium]|nr:TldD/PmbA family protein [Dehalococcoidia bacterium]
MSKELIRQILDYSQADQTEILYIGEDSALTRFANNSIHQNVAERNAGVSIRVVSGKRIGAASTNRLDEESLKKAVDKALEIAETQRENPDFGSLPSPAEYAKADTFVERTAKFTPMERAETVRQIISEAQKNGVIASGAFSTETTDFIVANSLGLWAEQRLTQAKLNLVVGGEGDASGYANYLSKDVADIDPQALAREAIGKCLRSTTPISLQPGEYTVILEPYAVGTLVAFLAYIGFSALALQEGRSFMCGKLGQKIMGENITIWDDGLNPQGMPIPFDFEGVPKQKVVMIENGIAKGVVYDSYTAGKEGTRSTGHGLPAPNTYGPMPLHLFMKEGDSSLEEMVASTKRGIYVTRFHYTNVVEPVSTTITGLTRDGTFLIEDGEVKGAVKNFRFTNSILKALSQVSLISRETRIVEGFEGLFGGSCVPGLKIDNFTFSGTTEVS